MRLIHGLKGTFIDGGIPLAFGLATSVGCLVGTGYYIQKIQNDRILRAKLSIPRCSFVGGLCLLSICGCQFWYSCVAKPYVYKTILDQLKLRGTESILDIGCGRGLFSLMTSQRLVKATHPKRPSGRVLAEDIWLESQGIVRRNAVKNGFGDLIVAGHNDATDLIHPDNHFDVVVASMVVDVFQLQHERAGIVREMLRVLKPGGTLVLWDPKVTETVHMEFATMGEVDDFYYFEYKYILPLMPTFATFATKKGGVNLDTAQIEREILSVVGRHFVEGDDEIGLVELPSVKGKKKKKKTRWAKSS